MHIKKGDQVKILSGKDRVKTGVVLNVSPKESKVTVEGLNMYPKRVRARQPGQKGEVVSVPRPLRSSKVMLICRSCKKPVRVGYKIEAHRKVRYCKKCGASF